MGHRNTANPPQILDTEHQGQNHTEQPYILMGSTSTSESSSFVHPGENININGGPFPSPWTTAPRSRINFSSIPNAGMPYFHNQAPGLSRDLFLHQPAGQHFHMVPDSNSSLATSSSFNGQTVPEAHGGFINQTTMGSGRGPYKRKNPNTPHLHDGGSTSRYYDVGSSSNLLLPSDPWQENQNTKSDRVPWEYDPGHRFNRLSIGGEGMQRNVRSRTVVDQDPNLARTHLTNNYLYCTFSYRPSDQSNVVDYAAQSPNTSTDWNHSLISTAGHGGTHAADSSSFRQGPNTLNALNGHAANNSMESGGSIPQNDYGYLNQSRGAVQISYDRRPAPTFRASSSNFYPAQVATSGEGPVSAAENFPSRHPQAISTAGFPYSERNVRAGMSNGRYRPFAQGLSVPDRGAPQDETNYPAYYSARAPFDQHRGLRLDVDNMSYEELLALGERIGSVNTGLSDGVVSKCLTQSIYCSSDQSQDDAKCVICLEEYKHMDDVGTPKCGHDFHAACIRKWLSIKNLCPVCKASAIDDTEGGLST